ncbi:MAG TPA: peptide deformylase [Prolixibacteraceae bacterium]|nr:peptide deformylase [Prolixibacteraceae bacterium]
MKLPIFSIGNSILRKTCSEVSPGYPELESLIDDMWETMYAANGSGLAAPQVGHAIRLFIVDSKAAFENMEPEDQEFFFNPDDSGITETFLNARIISRSEETWDESEGCLSVPNMSQKVNRPWTITIEYFDRDFKKQVKTFGGTTARVIQHEYDHTEGIIYLDHINPLTRKLISGKLKKISLGENPASYPMVYAK